MSSNKFNSSSLIRLSELWPDVHEWIYKTYARSSGVHKHEFLIYTDHMLNHANSPVDLVWQAGPIIHICSRIHPVDNADLFKLAMIEAFKDPPLLRELLRVPNESKADRFSGGRLNKRASSFLLDPITDFPKRSDINKYTLRIHTTVVMKDKATGREEHIEVINGNSFDQVARLERLMYGVEL